VNLTPLISNEEMYIENPIAFRLTCHVRLPLWIINLDCENEIL
jgi:hypothetical protein